MKKMLGKIVLVTMFFSSKLFSVIYLTERYQEEAEQFFATYSAHIEQRTNRKALKRFIQLRRDKIIEMQSEKIEYESLAQYSLDPLDQNILVPLYKKWLQDRIDAALISKGRQEGYAHDWLLTNLAGYKSILAEMLGHYEMDEELMHHLYIKEQLENYPSYMKRKLDKYLTCAIA